MLLRVICETNFFFTPSFGASPSEEGAHNLADLIKDRIIGLVLHMIVGHRIIQWKNVHHVDKYEW